MPWDYSDKVLELFRAAVRGEAGTHMGEIDDPDGFGEYGSLACGDTLRFTFRVRRHPDDPARDVITQARYLTFGCTSAIAASEALCALLEAEGKTPVEALAVTNRDLVDFLGGLPEEKIHCSVMGAEALQRAVADWAARRGVDLGALLPDLTAESPGEGRIVCRCFTLTEPYLRRKIRELGLRTLDEVTNALKAGGGCGECRHAPGGLRDLLGEIWGDSGGETDAQRTAAPEEGEPSPFRLGRRIEALLADEVRPLLQADGGDVELVDVKGYRVYCRLTGRCAGCGDAAATLGGLVEGRLRERIDGRLRVIAVRDREGAA